jgi:hypothetical protein
VNTDLVERAIQIVEDALELDGDARAENILRKCGTDEALLEEVESLLQHSTGIELAAPTPGGEVPEKLFAATSPDRYELLDELGRGGMGVVYRARDHQLGREVAIKVLRESSSRAEDVLHRFRAKRTSQLACNIRVLLPPTTLDDCPTVARSSH